MLNYYLNGQAVPAPLQLDGLTLKKSRNRRYWGFLYRKLGYVDGLSSIRFADADTMAVLSATLDSEGVQAETSFRIEQGATVLYDGFIDYATYSLDQDGVSIGLRDRQAVVSLETQATTIFGMDSSETISLHTRRLGGVSQLITDPGTLIIQRSDTSGQAITHSVPLTRRVEKDETVAGTLSPVIVPLLSSPIYYNTTTKDQLVRLSGVVSVTVVASGILTAELRAVPIGSESEAVSAGVISVTTTPTLKTIAVDAMVLVKVGAALKFEWSGSAFVNSWSFTYNANTRISLGDEPTIPASTGYGLRAAEVFSQVVAKATGGKLTARSYFLENDPDGQLFIANGSGIRGISTPVSISLQSFFDGLSAIFNLCLWIDGSVVYLERKKDGPSAITPIDLLLSHREDVAYDYLYNSVTAGYAEWQASDSTLSNDEPNGLRTYSTGISTVRNELNLVSSFITASGLIEQQRRKQFDPKTASEAKAETLDEKLFLIATVGNKSETIERTEASAGVYDPDTLYNIRLTPGRSLMRRMDELSPSLPLTAESVLGSELLWSSYAKKVGYEANPLPGSRWPHVPRIVTILTPMSMNDYALTGDRITYAYNGRIRTGELLDAEWKQTATGETGTLTLLER